MSSASSGATKLPLACCKPKLRAAATPQFSCCRRTTRGSSLPGRPTIIAVPSRDPSSTTRTSRLRYVCVRTDRSVLSINTSALNAGNHSRNQMLVQRVPERTICAPGLSSSSGNRRCVLHAGLRRFVRGEGGRRADVLARVKALLDPAACVLAERLPHPRLANPASRSRPPRPAHPRAVQITPLHPPQFPEWQSFWLKPPGRSWPWPR